MSFKFYVHECFAHMYICVLCVYLVPVRSEEGVGFPGTGGMDGGEPPCGYGELNLGPPARITCVPKH